MQNSKNKNAIDLDKLNALTLKDKVKQSKDVMFKFQKEEIKLLHEEQKKKRSKIRHKLFNYASNICLHKKYNKVDALNAEVQAFKTFYETNYINNDFKVQSVYSGSEQNKIDLLDVMFQIVNA